MKTPSKLIGGLCCAALCIFTVSKASAQLNPGFETAGGTANGAANWNTLAATGGTLAKVTRTNDTPHAGSFDMYFESQGNGGAPNTDLRSDPIAVTFGLN